MRPALLLAALLLVAGVANAAGDRHPLTAALDYDANLLLVSDLDPTNLQLTDLLSAARAAVKLTAEYDRAHEAALRGKQDLLEAERAALATGAPLAADQEEALAQLRQGEEERSRRLRGAVDTEIRRLRRNLSPEQARLVDFSRPADAAAGPDPAAALDELRTLTSRLAEAQRFIERLRYSIPSDYSITRTGRTEEYLRRYMQPGTPEFRQTRDDIMDLIGEARVVKENDWPQQAPVFASQVLQRVGLLAEQEPAGGQTRARYGWWDLCDLLTDPQTPAMLEAMLAARRDQ